MKVYASGLVLIVLGIFLTMFVPMLNEGDGEFAVGVFGLLSLGYCVYRVLTEIWRMD